MRNNILMSGIFWISMYYQEAGRRLRGDECLTTAEIFAETMCRRGQVRRLGLGYLITGKRRIGIVSLERAIQDCS